MACQCDKNVANKIPTLKVLDSNHRIGIHVQFQSSLYETLNQKHIKDTKCVQFFLDKNYTYQTLTLKDKVKALNLCNKEDKTFYIHCPFVANLSKDPKTLANKRSILSKSIDLVSSEIVQISGLPSGCILHIGSKGSIHNVINNINDMKIPRGNHYRGQKMLILENSAGQGTSLGKSWDELRKIYEGLDKNTVGLCIDTQHLFGSGMSKLQSHEDVVKVFDSTEGIYGKPDVIHLNDSKVKFNTKKDRHSNLTEGYIWNENDEGLKYLLEYCYDENINIILETPDASNDLHNIKTKYMNSDLIDVISNK